MAWLGSVLADVRHALRVYAKTPASTALVVGGLAATIAIGTAFLSLWSELEFGRPPGFEDRGKLVTIGRTDGRFSIPLSQAQIERIGAEASTVEAVAGVMANRLTREHDGEAEEVASELVTSAYFTRIGPRLQLGMPFTEADHRAGAEPVAIISYALWQRAFGGDERVIGTALRISGRSPYVFIGSENPEVTQDHRIVGVLAPGMSGTFTPSVDVWLPYEQVWPMLVAGSPQPAAEFPSLRGIARLAPGATAATARVEIEARLNAPSEANRSGPLASFAGLQANARLDVIDGIVADANAHRDVQRQLRLFLAGSLLLMLTAACNVSLYMLSRAPGRRRELAIKMAIGALPRRVARQLITEVGTLVASAAALGIVASLWLAAVLPALPFLRRLQWRSVSVLDWHVLVAVGALLALVAVIASLAPAMGLGRLVVDASGHRTTARGGWGQRLAGASQVALAAIVGAAAIAFIWHLVAIGSADRGFSAPDVQVVRLRPPARLMPPASPAAALATREQRRAVIAGLPGVEGVSFGSAAPGLPGLTMLLPAARPDDPETQLRLDQYGVDAGYFRMLGMTLRHGRMLEDGDNDKVIVNEALAAQLWGRSNVVGETLPLLRPGGGTAPGPEIVGVLRDVSFGHPAETVSPTVFRLSVGPAAFEHILIRTTNSVPAMQQMLQERIDAGEMDLDIDAIRPVEAAWGEQLAPDRARTLLAIVSALIVLVLAATGYYGTQRYLVAAGRRQHAIRAALGAAPAVIYRFVLRRGIAFGMPGLLVGSVLAFALVVWMRRDFVTSSVSPLGVTAIVAVVILALLLGATRGPAREAHDTEPAPLLADE